MALTQTIRLEQLPANLAGFAGRLSDPSPVTRAGAVLAAADARRRFDRQQAPDGSPWLPLAFARPNGGDKALLDTGQLRASLTHRSDRTSLAVGTNKVQAPLMHSGGLVRPVRAKYLAIPLTREAKRAGSPRRFRRPLKAKFGAKGGVLFEAGGDTHYALTKGVRVPARPFLGWPKEFLDTFARMLANYLLTGKV